MKNMSDNRFYTRGYPLRVQKMRSQFYRLKYAVGYGCW